MSFYVGGDTQTYNFDFFTKIANSVNECPLKIYKSEVNLNSLPNPTVQVTNMPTNGDFSSGTTGWSGANTSSFTVTNNTASFTCNAVNGYIGQSFNVQQRKYYLSSKVKTTSNLVKVQLSNLTDFGVTVSHSGSGNFEKLSTICDFTGKTINTSGRLSVIDGRSSGWTNIDVQQVTVIDLTTTFGAGNEPDQATCDRIFSTYFNGTITSNGTWEEIVSQSYLDKLKQANEIPITSTNTSTRQAVYNGQTLVQQSSTQVAIRDDYKNKVSGSVVENPNIAKYTNEAKSLQIPSSASFIESQQSKLNAIMSLDSTTDNHIDTGNGSIPQHLFSFNIIEMIKRKYGDTIGTTLAEQVAWCKANIGSVTANWYGYGSCPSGNKALITYFYNDVNTWATSYNTASNYNSSPTKTTLVNYSPTEIPKLIDSNGFVHFLAYTDPTSTTNDKMLVLSNHGLAVNDLIENTTRGNAITYITASTIPSSNVVITPSTIGQQSGDIIKKYKWTSNKVSETGTTTTNIRITNHGLSTGDYVYNNTHVVGWQKVIVVDANNLTVPTNPNMAVGDNFALEKFNSQQTAESQVIPSTIYTDYISIDIQFKAPFGYDILVPQNPRRDSIINGNYDNVVLLEKIWNPITTDFTGKIAGDTVTNGNIFKTTANSVLQIPSSSYFSEPIQASYNNIITQDGITSNGGVGTTVNGNIPQHLFSFDLVKAFEKVNGTIGASDKIGFLKGVLNQLSCSWYGYGSNPSGTKAYLKVWNTQGNSWLDCNSNTSSTPTLISATDGNSVLPYRIDSNGVVNYLASTDQASTTSPTMLVLTGSGLSIGDYIYNSTRNGYANVASINSTAVILNVSIVNQQPNDTIKKYRLNATTKTAETGTSGSTVKITNHGLSTGDLVKNSTGASLVTVVDANTFTLDRGFSTSIGETITYSTYLGQQTAESTVISSAIYTDYVKLDLSFKNSNNSYEFFTNNSVEVEVTTVNKASALMVEVDLSGIATSLGGNSALKSAFKAITVDAWCSGSGSNNGVLDYKCDIMSFFSDNKWYSWIGNTSSSILKTSIYQNSVSYNGYINSSNKIYFIILSKYGSDGVIASQVALDYINIKVDIARTPDVVTPLPVNLPQSWAMVVKGFAWNHVCGDSTTKDFYLMSLYKGSTSDYAIKINSGTSLYFMKQVNSTWKVVIGDYTPSIKNQVINILVEQNVNGLVFRYLFNNGTIKKYTLAETTDLSGLHNLYLLNTVGTAQADAFAQSFSLIDLTNKPTGYTDTEAQGILQGTTSGWETSELFDINAVSLHANATRSNGVITLNATGAWQSSYIDIPVYPNNRYEFKGTITASTGYGSVYATERYNNIDLKQFSGEIRNTIPSNTFTTSANTNKVRVYLTNSATGTFTFSNISLRRKD